MMFEIHPATLVDLPALHGYTRMAEQGVILDSELAYTQEVSSTGSALLSDLLLPSRSHLVLLVGRSTQTHANGRESRDTLLGQLRLKLADHLAQVVQMASSLTLQNGEVASKTAERAEAGAWLYMLDAMTAEAGRRGAHMLTAEVDEHSPLFTTMRTAGFAVYARQEIWQLAALDMLPDLSLPGTLREETDDDTLAIQLLYSNIVPRLVQPIAVPSRNSQGIVYRAGGQVQGYIAVSEGKGGLYLMPFLHPDVLGDHAAAILCAVLRRTWENRRRGDKRPVYVCVRRYQDWLAESLMQLGFTAATQQAVMVRHIAAGVRQAQFARLQPLRALTPAVHPPTPVTNIHRIEGDDEGKVADGTQA